MKNRDLNGLEAFLLVFIVIGVALLINASIWTVLVYLLSLTGYIQFQWNYVLLGMVVTAIVRMILPSGRR